MRRVEPASAPITPPYGRVIRPETVLTPLTLWSWPPKSTPPWSCAAVPCKVIGFVSSKPPTSWRAVPRAAEVGAMEIAPVPAERALPRRTTPPLMVRPPVQPALAEGRTRTPAPCLTRLLPAAERTKALETVRVWPSWTPSEFAAALRLN